MKKFAIGLMLMMAACAPQNMPGRGPVEHGGGMACQHCAAGAKAGECCCKGNMGHKPADKGGVAEHGSGMMCCQPK